MSKSKLILFILIIAIGSIWFTQTDIKHTGAKKILNRVLVKNLKGLNKKASYLMNTKDCSIKWIFTDNKNEKDESISMRLESSNSLKCNVSFKKQLKIHKQVLEMAFLDWDKNKVTSISTYSLNLLNPTSEWNIKIVNAAMKNDILRDYKENYPEHISKLSINEIFVQIANEADAYAEFKNMFSFFDIQIELDRCEKVFNGNMGKMREFGVQLSFSNRFGSMIYDAGSLHFKVK
jgi:hypothetical protein